MTAKTLMNAIGEISDRHIIEFADVRPHKNTRAIWISIAALAACFVMIISSVTVLNTYLHKDTVEPITACIVNDSYYELVVDSDIIKKHGLPQTISKEMIGNYVTTAVTTNHNEGKVYDYNGLFGESVLLFEYDSTLYYLFYCNPNNNQTVSFESLLNLFGFSAEHQITDVKINGNKTSSNFDIAFMVETLKKSNTVSSHDYNGYNDNFNSEILIELSGENTDTLVIKYYPYMNCAYSACTYFELSSEAASVFENQLNVN